MRASVTARAVSAFQHQSLIIKSQELNHLTRLSGPTAVHSQRKLMSYFTPLIYYRSPFQYGYGLFQTHAIVCHLCVKEKRNIDSNICIMPIIVYPPNYSAFHDKSCITFYKQFIFLNCFRQTFVQQLITSFEKHLLSVFILLQTLKCARPSQTQDAFLKLILYNQDYSVFSHSKL